MGLIERYKNYNSLELYEILGPDWLSKIGLSKIPKLLNKPVINVFEEFDDDTKQKYLLIADATRRANPGTKINVWATGSRVDGTWKTKEEAEQLATQYNKSKPKYSDYDYITNASIIPDLKHLGFTCHGIQNNRARKKVLITS